MSAVLTALGSSTGSIILTALGSIPLYVVVLFLPRAPSLIAIIVYTASLLSPTVPATHILRVILCTGALAIGNARLQKTPPILLFVSGWILFLLLGLFPGLPRIGEVPTHDTITVFFVECLSVIGVSFLRLSKRFAPIVGAKPSPITLLSFLMHLLTLATLGAMMLVIETLHFTRGVEILEALNDALSRPATLLAILTGIFLIPFACSVILSQATRKTLDYLKLTVSPESRLLLSLHDPIPIDDIQETHRSIREHFTSISTELRQNQSTVRDLQKAAEEKEEELRERELSAANLERLMDLAPWGMVSCSANGLIISANDEFCRVMGIQEREKIRGKHISAIDSRHSWSREILSVLMWALRDWKQLVHRDLIRHYSSARQNRYLEIFLKIAVSELAATTDIESLRTSDIAVTLYIREHPDLRDFQLRLLSPSTYEVLGTQVSDIGKMLRGQFSAIVGHLSVATEIVNTAMRRGENQLVDSKLMSSLREIEKLSRQGSRDLQEFELKITPAKRQLVRIDLHAHLQFGLDYLYELLAQDDRIVVELNEEEPESATIAAKKGSVHITANEDEVTRFLSYILYFIQQIMPLAPDIAISIGYESISSEAAAMLTGSHAGNYSRIILFHPGQSLTANMMTGKFHRMDALAQAGSQLEIALSLLYAQTAQLGGFLSAQSTPTKGTTITIYIPVERTLVEESSVAAKSRKNFKRKSFNEEASLTQNVLIVGTEGETLAALGNMLQHLGYSTQIKDPREIADEPLDDITFSGSGFGFPIPGEELRERSPKGNGSTDLLAYDLLILNVEHGPLVALPLIHTLEQRSSEAATLLVVDSSQEYQKMFSDWALLQKPFDLDSLSSAIKSALSRT